MKDKKTNVQILEENGILGDIRRRLGLDPSDTLLDATIDAMTADEILVEYSAWKLGSGAWWAIFKRIFDELQTAQNEALQTS